VLKLSVHLNLNWYAVHQSFRCCASSNMDNLYASQVTEMRDRTENLETDD
jgi:hypothetical protein